MDKMNKDGIAATREENEMKKLLPIEQNALDVLNSRGPLTPGHDPGSFPHAIIRETLDALVKKKRAVVEMTDDGPRYTAIRHA